MGYEYYTDRARKFCAYQERCHNQLRTKLYDWGAKWFVVESVICDMILENFLNEQRYADAYVLGKFKQNKWGKQKIIQHLKKDRVSKYCVRDALKLIDDTEYYETLKELLEKKIRTTKGKNDWQIKQKVKKFAFDKGYEFFLIDEILKNL